MKTIKEIEEKLIKFVDEMKKDIEELKKGDKKAPEPGKVIKIADISWIILDKTEQGYIALAEKKIDSRIFGNDNDWKESEIREYLNGEFAEMIEKKSDANFRNLIETFFPWMDRQNMVPVWIKYP